MSNVIRGQDVIIDIYKVDGYYPFVCAENVSMTKTGVPKSVKTIGDGPNAAYRMQSKGYTFTIDGLIPYDDAINVTAFDCLDRYENMLAVPFRMVWRDPSGTAIKGIYGSAYITEITFTGPNDFAGASINFLGTGPTENFDGLTACDSAIDSITLNSQTTDSITIGYTGAVLAVRFDYRIWSTGGFADISIFSGTALAPTLPAGSFSVSPILPNGAQRIDVTPVCANGSNGTTKSLSYTKT